MKILVIIHSKHRKNTLKLAQAMAEAIPLTVCNVEDAEGIDLMQYDIVGFGSGIYGGKISGKLFKFIASHIEDLGNVFVFTTSGKGKPEYNRELEAYLNGKCKNVLGSFACKGFCKWFIFALTGGIAKGHPDDEELENARKFICKVADKFNHSADVTVED